MALLLSRCPRCSKPILITAYGICENVLPNGSRCGWILSWEYDAASEALRSKINKHSQAPEAGSYRTTSWANNPTVYGSAMSDTLKYGTVTLDVNKGYLFLWHPLDPVYGAAYVAYADAGTIGTASGVILPLTQPLSTFHGWFDNPQMAWITIAKGHGLVVEPPSAMHPRVVLVRDGDQEKAWFNVSSGDYRITQ